MSDTDTNTNTNTNTEKFRFAALKVFLTYPTHLTRDEVQDLMTRCAKWNIKYWIYCHELGSHEENEEPYEHTHMLIWCHKKMQTTNCRFFDIADKHPNIQPVKNWNKSLDYVTKDDVFWSNFDYVKPLSVKKVISIVKESADRLDAVSKCATSLRDVLPILALCDTKNQHIDPELVNEYLTYEPKGWQVELFRELEKPLHEDREIHWWHEPRGNTGKTFACKMWMARHPDETVIISDSSATKDILNVLWDRENSGLKNNYVMVNLARQVEAREVIYKTIEQVKDGYWMSTKYKGGIHWGRKPHVHIFANWPPDMKMLSQDMWHVHPIE